ncbi:Tungsten-containing aldehyde:ferredoxin oxidoreductase (EC [Olavius sp. associated proteobacterium Delta 1]|nr:Tungsten-containing aldehyde:ferredoxin oxidoreductase (EC [Olavius sp. associated proteobacterium Delta 1]
MEPAGYDPRTLKGMGLSFAVSDRGACHLRGTFYKAELAGLIDTNKTDGVAELFIDFEERAVLNDFMILCRFYRDFYAWEELSKIIAVTTGMSMDKTNLRQMASRIVDEIRRFNLREGMTTEDDRLPERFFKEKLKDGNRITKEYMTTLVQGYYRLRGWDEKGRPLAKT